MSRRSKRCTLLATLVALSLTGCYSYSPFGYGGYPSQLMTPQGFPGPTSPGLQAVPPAGIPLGPQSQQWQQTIPSRSAQGAAGGIPFSPPQGATPGTLGTKPVPDPKDPEDSRTAPSTKSSGPSAATGIGTPLDTAAGRFQSNPVSQSTDQTDPFLQPVTPDGSGSAGGGPDQYGYDRERYAWLRGVVDYDDRDHAWHLIYAAAPDAEDRFGGDITLLDHAGLSILRNDDVVLVEGQIDSSNRDRLGKPSYRIDRIEAPLTLAK